MIRSFSQTGFEHGSFGSRTLKKILLKQSNELNAQWKQTSPFFFSATTQPPSSSSPPPPPTHCLAVRKVWRGGLNERIGWQQTLCRKVLRACILALTKSWLNLSSLLRLCFSGSGYDGDDDDDDDDDDDSNDDDNSNDGFPIQNA